MKYCFKKIFIGVSIALILMMFKSCEVHAAYDTYRLSNATSILWTSDFDICSLNGNDFVCLDGFNLTKSAFTNETTLYSNTNDYIMMKSFSATITYNSSNPYIRKYLTLTQNIDTFVIGNNNTHLRANQFLSSAKITTTDNTECVISSNIGATISYGWPYPALQVPTACVGKYIQELVLNWQSGYNYIGSKSIVDNIQWNGNVNTFITNNKNNTYLLYFPPGTDIYKANLNGQIYFNDSSYYQGTYVEQNYTSVQQQVNENQAELNKELYIASSWIGPSIYSPTQSSEMENAFTDIADDIDSKVGNVLAGANPSTTTFSDFINALVYQPIYLLNQSANLDFYDSDGNMTGNLCFSSFQQGGTNRGFVPIPFTSDGGTQKRFQFPCLTRDVYSHIKHVDSSFSYSVVGSPNTFDDSNSLGYSSTTFMSIWLLIQHGVLYYFLVITFIKVIKYCIDTNKAEIEVLEL